MRITRREALQRLTVVLGGAASSSTIGALLSGCAPASPPAPDWVPAVLSPPRRTLVDVVVDRILPPTDTPGAMEAGVTAFIDRMLDRWVEPAERDRFLAGLDALDTAMQETAGTSFVDATEAQQMALLTRLDDEAVQARRNGEDPLPFFATLKEWTIGGYYTSEAGATQELQWLAAPGRFDGDIPLDEVGRAWA